MYPMKRRLDGNAIRIARKERGLTMRELAEASGVYYQAISDVERGQRPTKEQAFKLAQALEFSPLEWTWNLPILIENLKELGANEEQVIDFLKTLETDEWIDLQRW